MPSGLTVDWPMQYNIPHGEDKELYLIGASLKDLGRKCFGFTKMDAGTIRGIKKSAFAAGKIENVV